MGTCARLPHPPRKRERAQASVVRLFHRRTAVPVQLQASQCCTVELRASPGCSIALLLQVAVVQDGPPTAGADFFVVSPADQTRLDVLANDAAVFGALTISSSTASTHGFVAPCANSSCLLYTPRYRFSGYDTVTYTAADGRGRSATSSATLRIATSPPGLNSLPAHVQTTQAAATTPFSGAAVTYDDQSWNLTLTITFRTDAHAAAAGAWRADTLSLLPQGSPVSPGSLQALELLARMQVEVVDAAAVRARLQGNLSVASGLLQDLTVRPPEGFGGAALVSLQICSQWTECSVRLLIPDAPSVRPMHAPLACLPMADALVRDCKHSLGSDKVRPSPRRAAHSTSCADPPSVWPCLYGYKTVSTMSWLAAACLMRASLGCLLMGGPLLDDNQQPSHPLDDCTDGCTQQQQPYRSGGDRPAVDPASHRRRVHAVPRRARPPDVLLPPASRRGLQ